MTNKKRGGSIVVVIENPLLVYEMFAKRNLRN